MDCFSWGGWPRFGLARGFENLCFSIDRKTRSVRLSTGETLAYDKLLLTTGSRVRKLSIPGATLPGVLYLRDMDDSLAIRARLTVGARLVMIGGGYIGLEPAAPARARGCAVTALEAASPALDRREGARRPPTRPRPGGDWPGPARAARARRRASPPSPRAERRRPRRRAARSAPATP